MDYHDVSFLFHPSVLSPKPLPILVATLALSSQLRQGLVKVQAESETRSHISCSWECKGV
jgi:hypothetical protein